MTSDRSETKLLVPQSFTMTLARLFNQHVTPHRFEGPGATELPGGRFYTTTIYFDTIARHLYQAASGRREDNLKVRAREYYSLHPSLTQLVTDPRQLVRFTPVVWLELKSKSGSRTTKRRIGIPKKDVPGFFGSGTITPEMIALQRSDYGQDAARVLDEVAALCLQYGQPQCVARLRRYAAHHAGQKRVVHSSTGRHLAAQARAGARNAPRGGRGVA